MFNVLVLGSKIPRLPGDHFQCVGYARPAAGAEALGERGRAVGLNVCGPVLNPQQSGFQPTVEPTGFQPVVVQFLREIGHIYMRTA